MVLLAKMLTVTFAFVPLVALAADCSGGTCANPGLAKVEEETSLMQIKHDLKQSRTQTKMWREGDEEIQSTEPVQLMVEYDPDAEESTRDKLSYAAETAVALAMWRAKQEGANSMAEKAAKDEALHALQDLPNVLSKSSGGDDLSLEEDSEEIEDSLAANADLVSPSAAIADGDLDTANDIARMAGSRGEEADSCADCYQGDMLMPDSDLHQAELLQENTAHWRDFGNQSREFFAGRAWTGANVKYCFADGINNRIKHLFEGAVRQYKRAVPCLTFEEVGWKSGHSKSKEQFKECEVSPAIFVQSKENGGCNSFTGMMSSPFNYKGNGNIKAQHLNLEAPGCDSIGTAVHELGHALGMAHEQSRPDRDTYVSIKWNNVEAKAEKDFEKKEDEYAVDPYDFESVMHYDAFAFSKDKKNPKATIVRKDGTHGKMGQRVGLSSWDVKQVVALYKQEISTCKGNRIEDLGCVDLPDWKTQTLLTCGTDCSGLRVAHCCACGGGAEIQCYKGEECPNKDFVKNPLPINPSDCLVQFEGSDEVHNLCKFDIALKCPLPSRPGSTATLSWPGGYHGLLEYKKEPLERSTCQVTAPGRATAPAASAKPTAKSKPAAKATPVAEVVAAAKPAKKATPVATVVASAKPAKKATPVATVVASGKPTAASGVKKVAAGECSTCQECQAKCKPKCKALGQGFKWSCSTSTHTVTKGSKVTKEVTIKPSCTCRPPVYG